MKEVTQVQKSVLNVSHIYVRYISDSLNSGKNVIYFQNEWLIYTSIIECKWYYVNYNFKITIT